MQNAKKRFMQHYKEYADTYDELRDNKSEITRLNAADQIEFVLNKFEDIKDLVEVGCGTGKFTIPLAKAGKKIIAIDSSFEMLSIARNKAKEEGVDKNIEFVCGDIENIGIKKEAASAVLSIAVIRHFKKEEKALAELVRILCSKGYIMIDYLSFVFFIPLIIKKFIINKHIVKGREWFENYYRFYGQMKRKLRIFNVDILDNNAFVLLPTSIVEKLRIHFLVKFIERKINQGSVVFLFGRKSDL